MGKTRKIKSSKSSKSGKSRTRFVKAKCGARNTDTNYTCYDSETLHKLKTLWNARHPDAKIQTQDDKEIWKALKENMSNVCNTEKCWLRQNFSKHNISEDLRLYTFAPNSPKSWLDNPNEWLSSVDIEKVMKQYEEKHGLSEVQYRDILIQIIEKIEPVGEWGAPAKKRRQRMENDVKLKIITDNASI